MLINSNSTIGRQHFTIAHELYHLFYDESFTPHVCGGNAEGEEKNANMFASALLLPKDGVMQMISEREASKHTIEIATVLEIEQYYRVSRSTLLFRLKKLNLISETELSYLQSFQAKKSAQEYGFELSLYEPGNEGLFIGDFGTKARVLFEQGKISEGHYQELLNMISDGVTEN